MILHTIYATLGFVAGINVVVFGLLLVHTLGQEHDDRRRATAFDKHTEQTLRMLAAKGKP